MGRRQILKCWAFISPQLEILWRLLVTRHWLVSYILLFAFQIAAWFVLLFFSISLDQFSWENSQSVTWRLKDYWPGIWRQQTPRRGVRHIRPLVWCVTFFLLLVSFRGVPRRPTCVGQCHCQRWSKRSGRCCALCWVRLTVLSRTIIILLTEISNFTACFPVLVQNIEQTCLEGVTAVAVCSYPYRGNLFFRVNSSKFPQRCQNVGGL